jgi:hypothetical protein
VAGVGYIAQAGVAGMSPEGLFTIYLYNLDWDQNAWTDEGIEKDRKMFDWLERD